MTETTHTDETHSPARATLWSDAQWTRALAVIGAITLARIVALHFARIDLSEDETQYWAWSQAPAFGYFSKPPLIAWVLWVMTHLFGDHGASVRLAAPLLHAGTALLIFGIARNLYDSRTAFWSSITYATLPAVSLSSGLISTDVPLLFCWALALHTLIRMLRRPTFGLALLFGAAIGFGLLAKYAMIYFLLCLGVAAFFLPRVRKLLRTKWMAAAGVVAALCVTPNLLWNAALGFPTFAHTAANANLGGRLFNPRKLVDFLVAQFGVFGPILFGAFAVGAERQTRHGASDGRDQAKRLLLSFSLPVLAAACVIALVSRANANWAAPAFVAATPLVVYWLRQPGRVWLFVLSLALHGAVAIVMPVGVATPALADSLGLSNSLKRVRGWSALGTSVAALARDQAYTAVLAEEREVMGELLYYARPRDIPVVMWDYERRPRNHYELLMRIGPDTGRRVLFVSRTKDPAYVLARFAASESLGEITVPLDPKRTRTVYLFALEGFKPRADSADVAE